MNLTVSVQAPKGYLAGWNDIVAISGVGPGELPVQSTGPHTSNAFLSGAPILSVNYPQFEPNEEQR